MVTKICNQKHDLYNRTKEIGLYKSAGVLHISVENQLCFTVVNQCFQGVCIKMKPTVARAPIAAMYTSPGPCYGLPSLTGKDTHDPRSCHHKSPAYIFGVRHGKLKDDCSPGPCYYPDPKINNDGMDGTPQFSLYGKAKDWKIYKTPGPGAYHPERTGESGKFRHPAFSFGARPRMRRLDNTPAPNSYHLPNMMCKTSQSGKRQAPCFSFSGRHKTGNFCEDLAKTPGPGSYNNTEPGMYKNRSPSYSMTSRNVMPGDSSMKPGPGAHSPEKTWSHKKQQPQFSFGIRHSEYLAPLIQEVQD